MSTTRPLRSALLSVYSKEGLEPVVRLLLAQGVQLYSTGGTQTYLEGLGADVTPIESLTAYPSILGGRVKTLHPKVFGGILARRHEPGDLAQLQEFAIPEFDLVVVDLYPFEQTLAEARDPQGSDAAAIVEKIDIGGISLIRAAAKNFRDVLVCAGREHYPALLEILERNGGSSSLEDRRRMAALAFAQSSRYDTAIEGWFRQGLSEGAETGAAAWSAAPGTPADAAAGETAASPAPTLQLAFRHSRPLRYGENPQQQARFYGQLEDAFEQLHGKELSYNNLVDLDAAAGLIREFDGAEPTFAIIKHTNPCGLASRPSLALAYEAALAGDPVSAFGGILIANRSLDAATAALVNELFCEIVAAPDYAPEALEVLRSKKNRILLRGGGSATTTPAATSAASFRSLLGGVLLQTQDLAPISAANFRTVTQTAPTEAQTRDLVFALKAVKHLKSNAIALASGEQLIGIGTGQTSRIDALQQAIDKAKRYNFEPAKAVLASDAFFPFGDAVEAAAAAGIRAIVQPGGSVRDQESIDLCNQHGIAMVFTGQRYFRH